MAQHLLIATATTDYPNLAPTDARPQLHEVLASVVRLFTQSLRCYRRELEDLGENPTADRLRTQLDSWFAAAERDPSDWVVLYYTGHAEVVEPDSLYLLTTDFRPYQFVGSAFSLQQLADLVLAQRGPGRRRRVRNVLFIIDSCFAGEGTRALTERLWSAFRRASGGAFYLLAAALPRQEANAGAFAQALIEAIEELSQRHVMQEWLFLEQIVPALNQRLRTHDAILSGVYSAREVPKFFPNPSYVDTAGHAVMASDAARAISDREFREHWGPRGRGVEFDHQPGSYFTGREQVLSKLIAYLENDRDRRSRALSGSPGAGKSAILSRLVSQSLPHRRGRKSRASLIDLAIHARDKTLGELSARIGRFLGTEPSPDQILDQLRRRPGSLRIVIDALDEAAEPDAIAEHLLSPLNAVESVKLVVGTRRHLLPGLAGAEVIDIDSVEYADRSDIARYVQARLLRSAEPAQATPYAGREALAAQVAAAVADQAFPNFLVARLIAEELLLRPQALDPEAVQQLHFPARVNDAFDAYLARFGARESMVRALLLPLAFAEGKGLPWDNLWAPLASALSQQQYADEDVRWLLAQAGAFVLESSEHGHSVYRLYHQALADTLRRRQRARSVHAVFARVLRTSVPRRVDRGRDWLLANQYVRVHLAAHAAASGSLARLLNDPMYLLAAEPGRLLAAMARTGSRVQRRRDQAAAVYRSAVHQIREAPPALAGAYLQLAARQRGQHGLAERIAALPLDLPWHVPWAHWRASPPNRQLGRAAGEIYVLGSAEWSPHGSVALIGRESGSVEVWKIADGERLAHWHPDGVGAVWQAALAHTNAGAVLVAGWSSGHLGSLLIDSGASQLRASEHGEQGVAIALCVAERAGQAVCITAHRDRRLLMHSLPSLEVLQQHLQATPSKIHGLATLPSSDGQILLSVGDSLCSDVDEYDHSMLRLWSLQDLSLQWEDHLGLHGALHDIEHRVIGGRTLSALSHNGFGPCQLWDIAQRRLLWTSDRASRHAWLYERQGRPLLIEANVNQLWHRELRPPIDLTHTWTAGRCSALVDIDGDRFSSLIAVHGRAALLTRVADHLRIWQIDDLLDDSAAAPSIVEPLPAVNTIAWQPPDLLCAGSTSDLIALDPASGHQRQTWDLTNLPRSARITALAPLSSLRPSARMASSPLASHQLAIGSSDGSIRLIDSRSHAEIACIQAGTSVLRLAVTEWRGQTLAFATVAQGRDHLVRVWDLSTQHAIDTGNAYQLTRGEQDKPLRCLAVAATGSSIRLAFASRYGKVMVADYVGPLADPPASPPSFPRHYAEWWIPASQGEYVGALACSDGTDRSLLAAGTERGHLALWDLHSGELIAHHRSAHGDSITALAFGTLDQQPVLLSGAADGLLRGWDASLQALFSIDTGHSIEALAWIGERQLAVAGARGVVAFEVELACCG